MMFEYACDVCGSIVSRDESCALHPQSIVVTIAHPKRFANELPLVIGHTHHTQLDGHNVGLVRCECGDVGDMTWLGVHVHLRRTLLKAGDVLDVSSMHRKGRS